MQKDYGQQPDASAPPQKKSRTESVVDETAEDLQKAIQASSGDIVKLPKRLAEALARALQGNEGRKECVCACLCGFYPPGTRLTKLESSPSPTQVKEPLSPPQIPTVKQAQAPSVLQQSMPSSAPMFPSMHSAFFSGTYGLPPSSDTYVTSSADANSASYAGVPFRLAEPSPYDLPVPEPMLVTVDEYTLSEWTQINSIPACLGVREKFLLEELIRANSILKAPMELSLKDLDPNEMSLMTVVRISDLAMRRIIAMSKKLSTFMSIRQEDQIALLKGGLSELLILRGVMCFDPNLDAWNHRFYQGNKEFQLAVGVLKQTPEEKHYEEHKRHEIDCLLIWP
ncbi:Ligand-binding domain of nuclear hormone receptor family protein, partial [Aphelenchoides avenae]